MTIRRLCDLLCNTLRGRLILSVALVHAVLMTLFIVDLVSRQRAALLDHQVQAATALSRSMAMSAATWLAADDVAGLQELVDNQRRYPEFAFAFLADKDGCILAHSERSRLGQTLSGLPADPGQAGIERTPSGLEATTPVMLGGRLVGWARVGIGQHAAMRKLAEIAIGGTIYALAAIVVGSALAWLLGNRITGRLYAIQKTLNAVKAGDRACRSRLAGADEAAQLAREFNTMLDALSERDVELRGSEERLRRLLDRMPLAAVIKGADGTIEYVNRRLVETFGYSHADIPTAARWYAQAYPDEAYRQKVVAEWQDLPLKTAAERRAMEEREYHVTCKDGKTKIVRIFGEPVADKLFVLFDDVTERQQAQERLRRAEKMNAIGQLAGGIAHDFNNQLSGILGFAGMLAARLDDPVLRHYVENIEKCALRSADLTRRILAFSRNGKLVSIPVDVHALIDETVLILERSVDKRVVISRRLEADPHLVLGDPSQLQSMLLNLAVNARDAMPDGGELIFTTAAVELTGKARDCDLAAGRYLRLCVADTGTGMTAEVQAHLFEPFFTTKAPGRGTGLGLAAVYGTVANHGGDIHVVSQAGQGTTCIIHLPLYQAAVADQAASERPAPPRGSAHVLVVDDEPMIRELLTLLLRELGYRVTACADGEQAIVFYRQAWQDVDLVLLDMVMPKMGGKDVFPVLRAIHPTVRVLVISGFSANRDIRAMLEDGALGVIQKPFQNGDVSRVVAETLRL